MESISDVEHAEIRMQCQKLMNTDITAPEQAVQWMGAMQAQHYSMAKLAVGVRIEDGTFANVESALRSGKILRTHVMRPTWHFVAGEDIRWMCALSENRFKTADAQWDKDYGLTPKIYAEVNRVIVNALTGNNHLTRQEIADELKKLDVIADLPRMIRHFCNRAEVEGVVCSGIDRGNKQTYALVSERAPSAKMLDKDESLATLATRYFQSHSPASLDDFIWWSGLYVRDAKQAVNSIQHDLQTVAFHEKQLFIHNSCSTTHKLTGEIHLLPAFDEYIIAYKDRESVIVPKHMPKAFTKNGIFQPIIVMDGKLIGTWKKVMRRGQPEIALSFFARNKSGASKVQIEKSMREVLKFWGE
ncbi:MAG: winged helix DNA-binding domain-containing protein [Bifidobacteriaceae bacterium]|jgi:hypothetical protein|nr:winged helix DNA-binding domain-containing protein [Bifidobacteriaceae bacterium]